jgi:predicted DNA-binding protein
MRYHIHLTDELLRRLKKIAKRDGLTVAEIIRRAVVDYLGKHGA